MELQQYGELLARLDQQQETVFRRDAEGVLDGSAAIESQAALIEEARRERELCRADLARSLGAPADASFDHLLPLLPEDYRPLIRALVEENNELLTRVRARSRQNHLLLSRTVELMQRLMGGLFAGNLDAFAQFGFAALGLLAQLLQPAGQNAAQQTVAGQMFDRFLRGQLVP